MAEVVQSAAEGAGSPASLPPPEKLTARWLRDHVPVAFWLWTAAAAAACFSAGAVTSSLPIIQFLFTAPRASQVDTNIGKLVREKESYSLEVDGEKISVHVGDVSLKRNVVALQIGLAGHPLQPYEFKPNERKEIIVGSRAYAVTIHDIADAVLQGDIAVVSLVQAKR